MTPPSRRWRRPRIRLQALLNGNAVADIAAQQQAVAAHPGGAHPPAPTIQPLHGRQRRRHRRRPGRSGPRQGGARRQLRPNYDKLSNGVDLTLRPEWSALQTAKNDYQTTVSNYNTTIAPPVAADVAAAQGAVASARAGLDAA
ncbi:MAG: hypothetical protein U0531_00845 [Dehalococcoidia bacterium]